MSEPNAQVVAVNVVHALRTGHRHRTAIDKRPVEGAVRVDERGLAGDRQVDRRHGGRDQAVYAYAEEDADFWAVELDRAVPPGLFGENLTLRGVDVTGAQVGERWRIGDVLLEVRLPRTPCANLALRVGVDRFHVRFDRSGRVGAMLMVVEPGSVCAGDRVEVVADPSHGVTIGDLATRNDPADMAALLESGVPLAATLRARAGRVVARSRRQAGAQQ